jgi:hypothetical protein
VVDIAALLRAFKGLGDRKDLSVKAQKKALDIIPFMM